MAMGLLAALHEEGLEAPRDVSVVGFDDLPEAPYLTPPLTTVRQDFAELGRRGVELVLARLAGEDAHEKPVVPELVIRASTGPCQSVSCLAATSAPFVQAGGTTKPRRSAGNRLFEKVPT